MCWIIALQRLCLKCSCINSTYFERETVSLTKSGSGRNQAFTRQGVIDHADRLMFNFCQFQKFFEGFIWHKEEKLIIIEDEEQCGGVIALGAGIGQFVSGLRCGTKKACSCCESIVCSCVFSWACTPLFLVRVCLEVSHLCICATSFCWIGYARWAGSGDLFMLEDGPGAYVVCFRRSLL